MRSMRSHGWPWIAVSVLLLAAICGGASAEITKVPRVMLVGDSWTGFMWAFRSFNHVIPEYSGLEQFTEIGASTAVMGARVCEYKQPASLAVMIKELQDNPTVDIVVVTLGGNDMMRGSDTAGDVEWHPSMSYAEASALFEVIASDIELVIQAALAVRPNIRVALCGYDYCHHLESGATIRQMNDAFILMEQKKMEIAQRNSRVFYVHNVGLMQYNYGIPEATPPVPPHTTPFPGGYPDYDPMPGGDPNQLSPLVAFFDADIHLSEEGYRILARHCMDEFVAQWMRNPIVVEVLPSGASAFQVTFSKPVTGVDVSDFAVAGAKAASVVSVVGSGSVYTVLVNAGGATSLELSVLDDDSIVDSSGNTLGGTGAGNGGFLYNGPFTFVDIPPPGPQDFDLALASLQTQLSPYLSFLSVPFSFLPAYCDSNGLVDIAHYAIYGNALLDSWEFAVIRKCLDDPSIDNTALGGVSHAIAAAAYNQNYTQMFSDLGGEGSLASIMLPGLDTFLAGLFTLGDARSAALPVLLMTLLANVDAVPVHVIPPNVANYVSLPQYFGLDGDADGDGYTNKQEYEFFSPQGRDAYVNAALDSTVVPVYECGNARGGFFAVDESFCLLVPDPVAGDSTFQWFKNGEPLDDAGFVTGTHTRQLSIYKLKLEDSGVYTCAYNDGAKAPAVFGPVQVTVANDIPAAHTSGLAFLSLVLAVAGAAILLQRKRRSLQS